MCSYMVEGQKWHLSKPSEHSLGFEDRKRECGTSVRLEKAPKERKMSLARIFNQLTDQFIRILWV